MRIRTSPSRYSTGPGASPRRTPFVCGSPSSSRTRTSFRSTTVRSDSAFATRSAKRKPPVGRGDERLEDGGVAVAVHHEARQEVGLAVG